jgi:hypothetical protein
VFFYVGYGNRNPNSILVNTGANDDPKKRLSKFYHYDAASQLVIGDRIAKVIRFMVVIDDVVAVVVVLLLVLMAQRLFFDCLFFKKKIPLYLS